MGASARENCVAPRTYLSTEHSGSKCPCRAPHCPTILASFSNLSNEICEVLPLQGASTAVPGSSCPLSPYPSIPPPHPPTRAPAGLQTRLPLEANPTRAWVYPMGSNIPTQNPLQKYLHFFPSSRGKRNNYQTVDRPTEGFSLRHPSKHTNASEDRGEVVSPTSDTRRLDSHPAGQDKPPFPQPRQVPCGMPPPMLPVRATVSDRRRALRGRLRWGSPSHRIASTDRSRERSKKAKTKY